MLSAAPPVFCGQYPIIPLVSGHRRICVSFCYSVLHPGSNLVLFQRLWQTPLSVWRSAAFRKPKAAGLGLNATVGTK